MNTSYHLQRIRNVQVNLLIVKRLLDKLAAALAHLLAPADYPAELHYILSKYPGETD